MTVSTRAVHMIPANLAVADATFERLLAAREYDPFSCLGAHRDRGQWCVRVFRPHADRVALHGPAGIEAMTQVDPGGVFEWRGGSEPARPWRLRIEEDGAAFDAFDCYAFPPQSSAQDLYLFSEGRNYQAWRLLGRFRALGGTQRIPQAPIPASRDGCSVGRPLRARRSDAGKPTRGRRNPSRVDKRGLHPPTEDPRGEVWVRRPVRACRRASGKASRKRRNPSRVGDPA